MNESPSEFLIRYTSHSTSPEKPSDSDSLRFGSPTFGSPDRQFCRKDNVNKCLAYLDQEIKVLGFQPLFLSTNQADSFDIVRLVNCTYELLQLQLQNCKLRTSFEERILRAECDNEYLLQNQARLKAQLESLEREVSMGTERERELQHKNKKSKQQLKTEKDETKKARSNFQQLQNQYSHENKKNEREMSKLKERVHQMLTDKSRDKKIGMELVNSIQRVDGKRATWQTSNRSEEDMLRLLITNYEARQKELIKENIDLRCSLFDMQAELVSSLNGKRSLPESDSEVCNILGAPGEAYKQQKKKHPMSSKHESAMSDECSELSVRSLPAGYFDMPYNMVKEEIEKSLRDKWRMLRCRLEQPHKRTSLPEDKEEKSWLRDEVKKLNNQLENYRHIVQQQEALIETMQEKENESCAQKDNSFLSDSRLCEEWEKLKNQKLIFNEQKSHFDQERRTLSEATARLSHERERFHNERGMFIKQQLMMTPSQRKGSPNRIDSPDSGSSPTRLKISTPVFSPAPSTKPPSTQDLYRVLSLQRDEPLDKTETPKAQSEKLREHTNSRSRRITEHAENVKRALQLKQGSPNCE